MVCYDGSWRFLMFCEWRKCWQVSSLSLLPLCARWVQALRQENCVHTLLRPLTHSSSPREVDKLMGVSMRSAGPIVDENSACACQNARSSIHDCPTARSWQSFLQRRTACLVGLAKCRDICWIARFWCTQGVWVFVLISPKEARKMNSAWVNALCSRESLNPFRCRCRCPPYWAGG